VTAVPPEWIDVAVEALNARSAQRPGSKGEAAARWHAVVALEAAAPLITAAERDRLKAETVTRDQLREEIKRSLAAAALRGSVKPGQAEALLLSAGEYAAGQVELHARPGRWCPFWEHAHEDSGGPCRRWEAS
jgi:hypothetical protein